VFESGTGDDYMKGYRVITNEGPLVVKIGNISMNNENSNENSKYYYAIGFALDNEEPEYNYNSSTIPKNITREEKKSADKAIAFLKTIEDKITNGNINSSGYNKTSIPIKY